MSYVRYKSYKVHFEGHDGVTSVFELTRAFPQKKRADLRI